MKEGNALLFWNDIVPRAFENNLGIWTSFLLAPFNILKILNIRRDGLTILTIIIIPFRKSYFECKICNVKLKHEDSKQNNRTHTIV